MKCIVGCLLLLAAPASALFSQTYAPGELFVIFKPNTSISLFTDSSGLTCCGIAKIDSINQANNCRKFSSIGNPGIPETEKDHLVYFPATANIPAIAAAYSADPNVKWAGPNYLAETAFTPNDQLFRNGTPPQWAMDSLHLNLERAWDITKGDTSVVIAVIDGGCFWQHDDIFNKLWINTREDSSHNGHFDSIPVINGGDLDGIDNDGNGFIDDVIGYDFSIFPTDSTYDAIPIYHNHGTVTSSLAGGKTNNFSGIASAGYNCPLMILATAGYNSVFPAPWQTPTLRMESIRQALFYAAHNGADVVNMSFGFLLPLDSLLPLKEAIDTAFNRGLVLVAAAHNKGQDQFAYPASYDAQVIGVASTDTSHYRSWYSNYSDSIDLTAPGSNWAAFMQISNPLPSQSQWAFWQDTFPGYILPPDTTIPAAGPFQAGTSLSVPMVAGIAGLVKSIYPNWTNTEIMAKLISSTDSIRCCPPPGTRWKDSTEEASIIASGKLGSGRLNAFKALTFYGNIPGEFANDTTLHDTVYVSGDITVRNGKTLTLAAGTVLRLYPGDVLKKGVDTTKTEIVVESGGKLIIEGTSGNLVKLVSFRSEALAGTNDWRGIVIRPGGVFACSNAVIRHAYAGIEDSSRYLHTIKNVRIGKCKMYGILAVNTDSLTIRGCRVDSVGDGSSGYGIYVHAPTNGNGAILKRDTVRNSYYGIYLAYTKSPVESCAVYGTGFVGIAAFKQRTLGTDPVPISHTSVTGYYTYAHFQNLDSSRAVLTSCNLISPTSPSRSPYGAYSGNTQAYLKVRKSTITEWYTAGVSTAHDYGQVTDLGSVASPADSGFNQIFSGTSYSTWKYVKDGNCGGNCTTPIIKAEWNCWLAATPSSSRFTNNIDYTPWDLSCMELPKIVAGGGETTVLPKPTALYQNYPNPFNPTTLIQFNLEKPEKVNLEIFNILGQKVRTMLGGEEFASGPYTFLWDGKDNRGSPLSSGMYFYRLSTPSFLQTKKMALVK